MYKNKLFLGVFCLMAMLFGSCSTDVDLYADFKDITVVYGLLDVTQDTNFIKINRAFMGYGNANDIALIADSCNYPGKLDCKLIEYRANLESNNYVKTQEYPLDTITIHNKDLGAFYAPDQLVYYTTGRIRPNTDRYQYRYDLEINRGDTIVTATTDVVGGGSFSIVPNIMNFSSFIEYGKLKWLGCPNSFIYEIMVRFYYKEIVSANDSIDHCVSWSLGTRPEATLQIDNGVYYVNYLASLFYANIAEEIGADSLLLNAERVFFEPSVEIEITAGGEELYNYITVNGSNSSIVQTIPEYTNINGGYGVFSSRTKITKRVRMSAQTVVDLYKHNWNFRQGE